MKSFFSLKEYDVFAAHTLREGLMLLKAEEPNVLFLDNNLPDGEGWPHAQEILKSHPSLKVYLISAYKTPKDHDATHQDLVVWEKPLSIGILNETFK
jgi:DNA-binding response OmpR family regulator